MPNILVVNRGPGFAAIRTQDPVGNALVRRGVISPKGGFIALDIPEGHHIVVTEHSDPNYPDDTQPAKGA